MLRDKKKQIAAEHRKRNKHGKDNITMKQGRRYLCIYYSSKVEEETNVRLSDIGMKMRQRNIYEQKDNN